MLYHGARAPVIPGTRCRRTQQLGTPYVEGRVPGRCSDQGWGRYTGRVVGLESCRKRCGAGSRDSPGSRQTCQCR